MKSLLAFLAGGFAFVLASAIGGAAFAAGCGCTPPPPPCCTPPPCGQCQQNGHHKNNNNVVVNIQASLAVTALANAQSNASSTVVLNSGAGGGGGDAFSAGPGTSSVISNLNVQGAVATRAAYEASRTVTKKVVIQAVCIDDKEVPHPASQVTPDRDIEDAYDNELYRCIAGTHMQATIAEFDGRIDFSHSQTLACSKGDALYHSPGGRVECRPQKPARDCNERSLLRRFGAGVKVLTMITVEKYTAYREESSQSTSSGTLSLDGGVGGVVY